jgi:hypothetical protein
MKQNAIRINDNLSVVVLLDQNAQVGQLTSRGFHGVKVTKATILNADGLDYISEGVSILQPDDAEDAQVGIKLALTRAVEGASFVLREKEERARIFNAMLDGFAQVDRLRTTREEIQQKLARLRELLASRVPVKTVGPYSPYAGPIQLNRTMGGYND